MNEKIKIMKKSEEKLEDLLDIIERTNIHIT